MPRHIDRRLLDANPCWSKETGDCPNRSAGCAVGCEKWREFEKIREQLRDEKANRRNEERAYFDAIERRKEIRKKLNKQYYISRMQRKT